EMVERERRQRGERLVNFANIPRRHRWAAFDRPAFELTEAARQALAWVARLPEPEFKLVEADDYHDGFPWPQFSSYPGEEYLAQAVPPDLRGTGLLIVGPVGTGKTTLVAATLTAAIRRTLTLGAFWCVADLLEALRPHGDREPALSMEWLVSLPLLALDDLGTERPTDWAIEQLDRLINGRYVQDRILLVTTNLSRKPLADAVGSRIASRLMEMTEPILLAGDDRRLVVQKPALPGT
ncbi:MAG: ATP-binding protein, partial [Bacillota bacterium]